MAAIVSALGLRKTFQQVQAVNGVSFDVQQGQFVTLLGPSGCGKTTTLRLIAGLDENDGGEIFLNSQLVSSPEKGVYLPPEKRGIGMVFQSYAIWPHMTVFENVAFPLRIRRLPKREIKAKVDKVLQIFDLLELAPRLATKLSGGQQQRVAIARALAVEPAILLMDEPLSNLDAKLRERMRFELRELQRRTGIATLYVTHDQAEAMVLSDRIIVMNKGKIEQIGTPEEIYDKPLTRFVSDFIGLSNIFPIEITASFKPGATRVKIKQNGRELLCRAVNHGSQRAKRLALVRPEHIKLAGRDEVSAEVNVWPGTVQSSVYFGESRDYLIKVDDVVLRARTSPDVVFHAGDSVSVHLPSDHVILVEES
jgi:iron(III) transport system ATP-binding protein